MRHHRPRWLTFFMVRFLPSMLLAFLVAACSEDDQMAMRLGTNIWPGHEPLYLARDLGSLREEDVRLVEFHSASSVLRAFNIGALDAAALTLDEVLLLLERGARVKILMVTDISQGGDAILAGPGFESFKDLAGARIGVEGTALGAYVLSRALELNDLALTDISVVQLEFHQHEKAFLDGDVDAIVTFEPIRSKLLNRGARVLFSSRDIPDEIVDVIVIHEGYWEENKDQLEILVDAWFRAVDYLKQSPMDAATRMGKRLQLGPDQVLQAFGGLSLPGREENQRLLAADMPGLLRILPRLQTLMLEHHLLAREVPMGYLFPAPPWEFSPG